MNTNTIYNVAVIGGGASGLMLACALQNTTRSIALFERGDRFGRKLSATGNGQGNITNQDVRNRVYFSASGGDVLAKKCIENFDDLALTRFFQELGVLLVADGKGRVYPTGRQASALTDALRLSLGNTVDTFMKRQIVDLKKEKDVFCLIAKSEDGEEKYYAKNVVLCVGGKAAKNFGTDGTGYALATAFGHTMTALNPSLVQLKTDTKYTKSLKGIRINDGVLTANIEGEKVAVQGDILFTDFGISGDATFQLSAFIADKTAQGVDLEIDFLPQVDKLVLLDTLREKAKKYPHIAKGELLFGIVNNQVGRAIMRRANDDLQKAVEYVKAFPLTANGTLGFDYAQVTKGGIRVDELDENLQSKKESGLYLAGEMIDVDGQCGGFNLQWAFASAQTIANALRQKMGK